MLAVSGGISVNVTAEKIRGAVIGAAVGDATGVPYEFIPPEKIKLNPVTDMVGRGTYNMPAGTWSDDTTMILCTLDKLDGSLDYDAIMRAFLSWLDDGNYTPYGECFDIGNTTHTALVNYSRGGGALSSGLTDAYSNGNGSLMRIIPVALYADAHGLSAGQAVNLSHEISSLTHAHPISKTGCGIFTCVATSLLESADRQSVLRGIKTAETVYSSEINTPEIIKYRRIFDEGFPELPESVIKSSGYVVDTLECALWCVLNTDNYRDCVLKAVNFGNDTDTAACVAGALGGLLYGLEGIPVRWRETLVKSDYINTIISGFCRRNNIE